MQAWKNEGKKSKQWKLPQTEFIAEEMIIPSASHFCAFLPTCVCVFRALHFNFFKNVEIVDTGVKCYGILNCTAPREKYIHRMCILSLVSSIFSRLNAHLNWNFLNFQPFYFLQAKPIQNFPPNFVWFFSPWNKWRKFAEHQNRNCWLVFLCLKRKEEEEKKHEQWFITSQSVVRTTRR